MSSWVGGAVACLVWLGTHGGFSGCGTCTAWLGPWPRRLWRCVWGVRGVCVCVCVWCVSKGGLSRCLAEEPPLRPDLVLVRWRPPRQLLLLSPGLRCGRLHFLPLASAGRLEAGASVWRTGRAGSIPPLPGSSSWGRSELLWGQRGRAVLGTATYRGFLMGGESQAWHLASARPSLPPRGPLVCVCSNRNSKKKTHPRIPFPDSPLVLVERSA